MCDGNIVISTEAPILPISQEYKEKAVKPDLGAESRGLTPIQV
ncbi:MAG: hypothetical protein ACYS9C_00280 [Planctomycetota bacterium]|jgi:hypothetical protein